MTDHFRTSGWALLPLRLFLGVTFLFAGLQKLADPGFFRASDSGSIGAQLHAATTSSPIGGLLGGLADHATFVGLVIAIGEVAVGLGALLGLWTRVAAAGGMALSLGFLLTVSWHSHPYYLGPDIVFAAAWAPLVLAGAGDDRRLSADAILRDREERAAGVGGAGARLPGAHRPGGRQDGRTGSQPRPRPARGFAAVDIDRRTFLAQARLAGLVALGGTLLSSVTAGIGRSVAQRSGTADTATALPPPRTNGGAPGGSPAGGSTGRGSTGGRSAGSVGGGGQVSGVAIGPADAVPVGGAASFVDPTTGAPAYVSQPSSGQFVAFSAICTHAGCQVRYVQDGELVCPCHGARFEADTGQVIQGPAARPLPGIDVAAGPDGQLYVQG